MDQWSNSEFLETQNIPEIVVAKSARYARLSVTILLGVSLSKRVQATTIENSLPFQTDHIEHLTHRHLGLFFLWSHEDEVGEDHQENQEYEERKQAQHRRFYRFNRYLDIS